MDKRGITLIALIITIIVLLILAGITLNMLLGDNGIIKRAREAGEEYTNKAIQENEILSEAEKIMQNYIGGIGGNNNEDNHGGDNEDNNGNDNEEDNNPPEPPEIGDIVEMPDGKDWDTDKINPTIVDEDENVIPIPKELEYKEGTKDTGVVVIDPDTLNEFVWVPTDEIEYKRDNFTKTSATKDNSSEPDYNTDYTDSVTKYGGFYIARYEAGIQSPRTVSGATSISPKFQKNKYPYNWVNWQQAKDLSVGLYSGSENIISDLINSYAWDTTLRWIESTNPDKDADTNSTSWGNFRDKLYTITGLYSTDAGKTYKDETYTKSTQANVLLGTGVLGSALANNIYDLAGNLLEWTTELYNELLLGNVCRINRGGRLDHTGSIGPAGNRNPGEPSGGSYLCTFRVVLYVPI